MNKLLPRGIDSGQAGFTLIELLIAIAIFSIGFMAVGGLQMMSLKRVGISQDKTIATTILEDQDVVSDCLNLMQMLGTQENGDRLGNARRHALDVAKHGELGIHVEVCQRFVQNHQVGTAYQGPGQGEAKLIATGQLAPTLAEVSAQTEPLDNEAHLIVVLRTSNAMYGCLVLQGLFEIPSPRQKLLRYVGDA